VGASAKVPDDRPVLSLDTGVTLGGEGSIWEEALRRARMRSSPPGVGEDVVVVLGVGQRSGILDADALPFGVAFSSSFAPGLVASLD